VKPPFDDEAAMLHLLQGGPKTRKRLCSMSRWWRTGDRLSVLDRLLECGRFVEFGPFPPVTRKVRYALREFVENA
jgi:hypothetical protein